MVDTNAAYVAGLIDGEGCIHLESSRGTFRARVTVGMSEPALALLESLRAEWGGTLYRLRPQTERWAAAWTWHTGGDEAARLLRTLLPYLRLKVPQARVALEVEAIRAALPRRANGQARWTSDGRAACSALKSRLHELNAKGPRASARTAGVA